MNMPQLAPPAVEPPMLGRDLECEQLAGWLRECVANRRAQVVLVRGPEGIGRRVLCRAALAQAATADVTPAWRVLHVGAQATRSGTSLGVLRDLLHAVASLPEGTPLTSARGSIEALVESASLPEEDRRSTADFLGELLAFEFRENPRLSAARRDPRMMGDLVRMAVGDLFAGWCEQGPVLLVVDHLELADTASRLMLGYLLRRLRRRPLTLLASCSTVFNGSELGACRELTLRPLSAPRMAELVELVRGRAETSILHRAAGVPYLAVELARYVREGGDPDSLPESLTAALHRRLFALPPDDLVAIRRAAVLGERFWLEGLVALGEQGAPLRPLRALAERRLIVQAPAARFRGVSEWRFTHPAVHRVALEFGAEAQRHGLHALAARWLQGRSRAITEEVARHHRLANEDKRAIALWFTATVEADHRGDACAVLEHSDRALSTATAQLGTSVLAEEDAFTIRVRRADALYRMGRARALDAELDTIEQLGVVQRLAPARTLEPDATALGEREPTGRFSTESTGLIRAARATLWTGFDVRPGSGPMLLAPHESRASLAVRHALVRGRRLGELGHFDEALDVLASTLPLADSLGERTQQARTRALLVAILAQCGRQSMAVLYERDLEKLVALDPADDIVAALTSSARATLGALRGELGETQLVDFLAAAERFARAGCVRESVEAALNAGATLLALGDYPAATATLGDALALARALDLRRQIGWTCCNLGMVDCELGHLGEARALLEETVEIGAALGDLRLHAAALCNLSALELRDGQPIRALECVLEARAIATRVGGSIAVIAAASRTIVLVALERHVEALSASSEAQELAHQAGGIEQFEVELALATSVAREACGRPAAEVARPVLEAFESFAAALSRLRTPRLRRSFAHGVRAHRTLVRRAMQFGIEMPPELAQLESE